MVVRTKRRHRLMEVLVIDIFCLSLGQSKVGPVDKWHPKSQFAGRGRPLFKEAYVSKLSRYL